MDRSIEPESLVIFTDLDGTLLDHDSYSWDAARSALSALRAAGIPLVLASSKTAAEIAPLRAELGFAHVPAIVENGAGVLGAHVGASDADNSQWHALRDALARMPADLRGPFRGFGDLGIDGVMDATGLSEAGARLAVMRCYSEPGLWTGSEHKRKEFVAALAAEGIAARDGGRFLTLSLGGTKAARMDEIAQEVRGHHKTVQTVALGDAPNDREMLLAADIGFLVRNPHAKPIVFDAGENATHIIRTEGVGPVGWNQAVLSLLSP